VSILPDIIRGTIINLKTDSAPPILLDIIIFHLAA
jgi:hypothetical protein